MTRPAIFYAWQNDRPRRTTRNIIRDCADAAVASLAAFGPITDAPRLDHDTLNQSGTPPIAETIFRKIQKSAVFLADVTLVAESRTDSGEVKQLCNPNVMVELGYAAATIGWDRIILVMNEHYGNGKKLPFDLRNHRFPITFDLGPNSQRNVEPQLREELAIAFRTCLSAEYELIDSTLQKLSAFSRGLMKEYGPHRLFWETSVDNKILSRFDLAVTQMLEAGVVNCVDAVNETGVAYTWTYLGQQCCLRLGAPLVEIAPLEPGVENVIVDHTMYDRLDKTDVGIAPDSL